MEDIIIRRNPRSIFLWVYCLLLDCSLLYIDIENFPISFLSPIFCYRLVLHCLPIIVKIPICFGHSPQFRQLSILLVWHFNVSCIVSRECACELSSLEFCCTCLFFHLYMSCAHIFFSRKMFFTTPLKCLILLKML